MVAAGESDHDDPTHDGHGGRNEPVARARILAQERTAQIGQKIREGVIEQEAGVRLEHGPLVHHRRDVEADEHEGGDELGDVPVAGRDEARECAHPARVEKEEKKARHGESNGRGMAHAEDRHEAGHDHEIVKEDDEVPPDRLEDVDEPRRVDLAHVARGVDVGRGPLVDDGGDEGPDDETDSEERKVLLHRLVEENPEDEPNAEDHDACADREPKGTEARACVTLADLGPAEEGPETPAAEALDEVPESDAEGSRGRGSDVDGGGRRHAFRGPGEGELILTMGEAEARRRIPREAAARRT